MDFRCRFCTGPGSAVPEPATWAMMLLGFGFAGMMLRRRSALQHAFS
ncbi:MAG: PEP-CTERM sorting domain-containing protein [Sphingomonadales bacterium]|nr:PEP-CTERM sorting domain-containing protein [Sphingomonadales bacterium]